MKVYLSALFLSMCMAYIYQTLDNRLVNYTQNLNPYMKQRKIDRSLCYISAALSALPFIVITGLRYRVGTDYLYYAASFNRVNNGNSSYFANPVYNLLEWIAAVLADDYMVLFCVTGTVLIGCYWFIIYRRSCYPIYSIFLFWGTNTFYISLNGVRQGIAMGFLFIAIQYALKKELKPYLFFFVCAVLTHRGVAYFLPVYWLFQIKLKPRRAWIILGLTLAAGLVGSQGLYYIIRLLGYGYYISSMFNTGEFEWFIALINIVVLCVFCFYERTAYESEYREEFQAYFWLQLLATASVMLSVAIPLAKRICWTFSIGQILSLPLMTKFEKSKIGKLILNLGIILGFILSIYFGIVVKGAHKVLPYRWWTERF
ncbi:MAG: EpsG family protein [Lachnospiraceae bacterium]|nr:EpsG family protein [Lachnospiraceae bacterium]